MNVYEQMVKKGYAVTNRKEEPKAATQEIPDEPVVVPEAKGKRGGVKTQQPMPEKPRPSIPRQKLKIFSDITESEVDICHKEITDEYAMIFVCDDSPVKIAAGKGKSLSIEHSGEPLNLYSPGIRVKAPMFNCEVVLLLVDDGEEE